jgi:hypothetical protein
MIKKYLKQNKNFWILAIVFVLVIKSFSPNKIWVETTYATKFYSFFSRILRVIFGWIPFSVGDILYLAAGSWLLWKVIKNVRMIFKKEINKKIFLKKILRLTLIFVFIYIVFNIFWGINYNRQGIAYELHLTELKYDSSDLITLQNLLLQKVNASKLAVINSRELYPDKKDLFRKAKASYDDAAKIYPFLQYKDLSIKSSFYGWLGNYLGFTGYYNPFTGEAQVNTTVPKFMQPYIATHEMAHQLGYAKENEANFVGYLAAANSRDSLFRYSTYFDLFLYANREVYYFDSVSSKNAREKLNPYVKKDIDELKRFNLTHRSFIEPAITWLYGKFLKLNEQPQGMHTYNAVVGMLIAYYKKYGKI